jgi:hypothetical protein
MSNIDKRALREIAEAAVGAHERLSVMPPDDIFDISLAEGTQLDADITALNALNSAANPTTVLALLDELEAKDKRIAELSKKADIYDMLRQDYGVQGSLVEFVDWQAKRIAEYQELISGLVGVSSSILREVERISNAAAAGKGE